MGDATSVVIHGHFYQPPRENPWTGILDREASAAPAHDWNARILAECYRPNAFARVYDAQGRVSAIVNNYAQLSFNMGPTLLSWLERADPETYRRVLEADAASLARLGHGAAIAQAYNHCILPLCNARDRRTQITWGLSDFRHRFGRDAEALWLPETACDEATLEALIDAGMRYAILAPGQAAAVREGETWRDVRGGTVDPTRPYAWRHRDGSGRSIALFFYDGGVARSVAFEGLLGSSRLLVDRLLQAARPGGVVHIATDGESYGHHFRHGERCLAHAFTEEAARRGLVLSNYGAVLDRLPPTTEVRLAAGDEGLGTAWSCAHGVGRWHRDCGCHAGGPEGWTQQWRGPLRKALDVLRDAGATLYEEAAGALCEDPWALRDAYGALLVDPCADRARFFERHAGRALEAKARTQALTLLEMQRDSMLMYTSCGWFFSELSGLETRQILGYAGRMLDRLEALGMPSPRARFLEALAEARSNLPEWGNGADVFRREVARRRATPVSLAAHVALMGAVCPPEERGELGDHRFRQRDRRHARIGRLSVATARVDLEDGRTGASSAFETLAVHSGATDLLAVLRPARAPEEAAKAAARIWQEAESGSLLRLLRAAEHELGSDEHGLDDVLPSGRETLGHALFARHRQRFVAQLDAALDDSRRLLSLFHDAGLPAPEELRTATEIAVGRRFERALAAVPAGDASAAAYEDAQRIADRAARLGCELERGRASAHFEARLVTALERLDTHTKDAMSESLALLKRAEELSVPLDLGRAQERVQESAADGLDLLRAALRLRPRGDGFAET